MPQPARLFEHFVVADADDAVGHIPKHRHGMLGDLTPAERIALRTLLAGRLDGGRA
jgi:hypothetical protein